MNRRSKLHSPAGDDLPYVIFSSRLTKFDLDVALYRPWKLAPRHGSQCRAIDIGVFNQLMAIEDVVTQCAIAIKNAWSLANRAFLVAPPRDPHPEIRQARTSTARYTFPMWNGAGSAHAAAFRFRYRSGLERHGAALPLPHPPSA